MNLDEWLQSIQDITKDLPIEGNETTAAAVVVGMVLLLCAVSYRRKKSSRTNSKAMSTSNKAGDAQTSVAAKKAVKKRKNKQPTLGEIQAKLREEKRVRLQQRPKLPVAEQSTSSHTSSHVSPPSVTASNLDTMEFAPLPDAKPPNFVQMNRDGSPDMSPFDDSILKPLSTPTFSPVQTPIEPLPDLQALQNAFTSMEPISDQTCVDPKTQMDSDYVLSTPSSPLSKTPASPAPTSFAVDPVEIEVLSRPLEHDVSPVDVVPVAVDVDASNDLSSAPPEEHTEASGFWSRLRARFTRKVPDIELDIEGSRTDLAQPVEASVRSPSSASSTQESSSFFADRSSTAEQAGATVKHTDLGNNVDTSALLDPRIIREDVTPEVQALIDKLVLDHTQNEEASNVSLASRMENAEDSATASIDAHVEAQEPEVVVSAPIIVPTVVAEEPVEIELPWELEEGLQLERALPTKRLTSQLRKAKYALQYEPRDVWYVVGHQYRVHYATTLGLWTERDVQVQYMVQGKDNMWLSTICLDTQRHYFVDTARVVQAWDLTDNILVYSGIRSDLIPSTREQWWNERTIGVTKELLRLTGTMLEESISALHAPVEIEKSRFDWRFWRRFAKPSTTIPTLDTAYNEPILDLDIGPTALMRYQDGLSKNVSWNALALCLRWIASHYPSALNHSGTYVLEMLHRLHDTHRISMTDWLNLRVDEEAFVQCVDYLMRVNYGVGHVLLVASINLHAAQEAWAVHNRDHIGALDLHHDALWYIEQRFWEYYQKSPV